MLHVTLYIQRFCHHAIWDDPYSVFKAKHYTTRKKAQSKRYLHVKTLIL